MATVKTYYKSTGNIMGLSKNDKAKIAIFVAVLGTEAAILKGCDHLEQQQAQQQTQQQQQGR